MKFVLLLREGPTRKKDSAVRWETKWLSHISLIWEHSAWLHLNNETDKTNILVKTVTIESWLVFMYSINGESDSMPLMFSIELGVLKQPSVYPKQIVYVFSKCSHYCLSVFNGLFGNKRKQQGSPALWMIFMTEC